jgi:hypothetical protein
MSRTAGEPYTTTRIWVRTRRLLRKIAANTDESMVEVMQRLVRTEWDRVKMPHEDIPEGDRQNEK